MPNNSNLDKSGILIFVSYATKDVDAFRIRTIAEKLTDFEEIEDVLYWQEDMHDNIFKFMNDNLGKCDVMLLFCSKNAMKSVPVEKEWTAADSLGKPIIPIFTQVEDIPPLLSSRLGVKFDTYDFQETIQSLHDLIIKKSIEVVDLRSQLKHVRKEKNYLILFNLILVISGIYLIFLKGQTSDNLPFYWITSKELTTFLFIGLIALLALSVYLLFYNIRILIDLINTEGKIIKSLLKYIVSVFSVIVILYFLINRSYNFANFFVLISIYIPLISFLFAASLYLILKKTQFKALRLKRRKIILIMSLILCFYLPIYPGAIVPISNPNVIISPMPTQIYYEHGWQVQDIKEINGILKAVEGNARNVFINIDAPQNFSYWVDDIINGTKSVSYLEYGQQTSFSLKIQPSVSVGDGWYYLQINLSYESVLGDLHQKTASVLVSIVIPGNGGLIIPGFSILIIIISLSLAVIAVLYAIKRKKKYESC